MQRLNLSNTILKNHLEKNQINKVWIFLIAFSFIIPHTSAVYVTSTNKIVNQSQTFDINILIDPLNKTISGAQLDIAYNRSMFKVNSISEGKLLNQNGANTFYSGGVIDNITGKIKNIFNVIIGNKGVSSPGVFIIVNMTAIGTGGASWINLTNVKISDLEALPLPVESTNGSIKINSGNIGINSPPVLAAIGNKMINKGKELNLKISAIDTNTETLSYSASNLPSGATFNPLTATFVWASPLIGTYQNVHFEVSDGMLIDSENITITVSDFNDVPTFTAIPANSSVFNENDTIQIKVTANDLNNDALSYSIQINGKIVSTSPSYNWITNYTSSGNHMINISVSDGKSIAITTISVYINNVYPRYDVDENGIVDNRDLNLVALYLYQKVSPPYPRYDVNMDGVVNFDDYNIVIIHYYEKT